LFIHHGLSLKRCGCALCMRYALREIHIAVFHAVSRKTNNNLGVLIFEHDTVACTVSSKAYVKAYVLLFPSCMFSVHVITLGPIIILFQSHGSI